MERSIKDLIVEKTTKNDICCPETPMYAIMSHAWCLKNDISPQDVAFHLTYNSNTHAMYVYLQCKCENRCCPILVSIKLPFLINYVSLIFVKSFNKYS